MNVNKSVNDASQYLVAVLSVELLIYAVYLNCPFKL